MPRLVKPPAIVLFDYQPGGNFHDEPVYNTDVLSPDDAPRLPRFLLRDLLPKIDPGHRRFTLSADSPRYANVRVHLKKTLTADSKVYTLP